MADTPYTDPVMLAESVTALGSGQSPLSRLLGNLDERPTKLIPWPGNLHEPDPENEGRTRPVCVRMWALTDQEGRGCLERSVKFYADAKIPMELADKAGLLQTELRVQTLALAMRHPDTPMAAFARDTNEVRRMTPDLQDALHGEYIQWLDERSPLRKVNPAGIDANMEALMVALGKGVPPGALLSFYDTGTLRLYLARSLFRLMEATRPGYLDSSSVSGGATNSSGTSGALDTREDDLTGTGMESPGADEDGGFVSLARTP